MLTLLCAQDFAEAIAQLAMYPPGRDALLENPNVAEALQQVAVEGWTEEARLHAESALAALKPPEEHSEQVESGDKHVMVSYQWDVQRTIERIVRSLEARGYDVWFDLDRMKGSTMDAMSEGVDGAEVVLFGVSLAYKESGNCRLEANYAHQQQVDMIPLMMEKGYNAKGWLGLLLGTRVYYRFYGDAEHEDQASFEKRIDAVVREIGDRGKHKAHTCGRGRSAVLL